MKRYFSPPAALANLFLHPVMRCCCCAALAFPLCPIKVGIISASPLSMGLLTPQGPPEWHPAPPELKQAAAAAADYCKAQGMDIAKLALQFAVK
jgi:hypothetical protein